MIEIVYVNINPRLLPKTSTRALLSVIIAGVVNCVIIVVSPYLKLTFNLISSYVSALTQIFSVEPSESFKATLYSFGLVKWNCHANVLATKIHQPA